MFESLTEYVSGSPWTYAFLVAIAALDVLLPVVPSETSVILAGVLASSGDLMLPLVVASAAAGAIIGDNTAYWIGRGAGARVERRLFSGDRRSKLEWAESQIQERGGYLIVIARFIPGGRTATTFACGLLEYPWRRFVAFDVVAGLVWASYAALLGFFGGRQFEDDPLLALLLAAGIAFGVAGAIEAIRWLRRRRTFAS